MEIILKNGEKLNLEVSPLILEYIEAYEGGLEQLKRDISGQLDIKGYTKTMKATNHLIYSIIASNYKEELTHRQAVRLVKLEDIPNIVEFANKNIPSMTNM